MSDIWLGIAIMTLLGVGAFLLALRVRLSRRSLLALAVGVVVAILLFIHFLMDNILMARVLPFSNLVVVGNWLPVLAGFLGGLAWRLIPGRWWRRGLTVIPLIGICLWKCWGWYFEPPATTAAERWEAGVCIQTSESTCSAASAATLFAMHGVPTTEAEMVNLCMTRDWGTSMWGVYRGLKEKASHNGYSVEVFRATPDELLKMRTPALLVAGIRRGHEPTDPRYVEDWGWTPGVFHAACYLRPAEDGLFLMADPSVGPDHWSRENLDALWSGVGLRLLPRK